MQNYSDCIPRLQAKLESSAIYQTSNSIDEIESGRAEILTAPGTPVHAGGIEHEIGDLSIMRESKPMAFIHFTLELAFNKDLI